MQEQLILRKIEVYCPIVYVERIFPRACKAWPYFPGYLFVQIDLNVINPSVLRWLPGAIGLVHFGGEPAYVPDNLLKVIRCRVEQINAAGRNPVLETLKPGDEVTIHAGPFAGYEAVFCAELHGSERVQVLLRLLKDHTVRVDLPVSQIKAIKQNRR